MLLRLAAALGFGQALVHVETVTPTGAQLRADPALALDTIGKACEEAAAGGARTVIVGGAGLAGLAAALQPQCPLPLIDSAEAGLRVLLRGQAAHAACQPEEAVERLNLVRAYTNAGRNLGSMP
jgi:Asp/Glu/hydantoin racemase